MADFIKSIVEAFFSLFIIAMFAIYVFPEIGKATGQNVILYIVALVLLGAGVILGVIFGLLRRL